jgi:hypothetical protein
VKRAPGHPRHDRRSGVELDADSQQAEIAGRGYYSLGHFSLNHQYHRGRGARELEIMPEDGARDVIRNVSGQFVCAGEIVLRTNLERISLHDVQVGGRWKLGAECCDEMWVQLHRDDAPGSLDQAGGKYAGPRPNLEHHVLGREVKRLDDRSQIPPVPKKILSERLSGSEFMPSQDGPG